MKRVALAWVSADGTAWSSNWLTLTNETEHLRGGLYVDRTGVWGGDLIAVTGQEGAYLGSRGVWRIDAGRDAQLLTRIETYHLEGVITLANDARQWGPWAGRIIAGDENSHLVYSIDTNAVVEAYPLRIDPEDFDLAPADEDLYCIAFAWAESKVLKLSRALLANHVGDLMITQAGEVAWPPALYMARWDGADIITWRLPLTNSLGSQFEHAAFAPFSLPSLTE